MSLADVSWVPDFVEVQSRRHALLAERLHTTPQALDSESKVLAGLIELGRQVVEDEAETALYNEHYRDGVDDETAAAFALYDVESAAAVASEVRQTEGHT